MNTDNPLDGYTVLDLTRLLPGAVCTLLLADLGAQVIKIEDPNGGDYARWMPPQIDGQSVFFRMNNRGKQSVIVDLKQARGGEVLRRLVAQADVLVEGFRPGVMARLGCDYDTLKEVNPRLVYCSLSGWGAHGPYAQTSGHDLNYATVAGLVGAGRVAQPLGGQVADIGGAYAGVAGILGALLRRERSGEGAYIDVGLAEAAVPFVLYNWVESLYLGTGGGEGGLTGGLACYRVYTSSDGQAMSLAALEPKFWANFCQAIERIDLIDNHQSPERQTYLIRELEQIFAMRTAAEWDALLGEADCCFTLVRPPGELGEDPHLRARGMVGRFADGTPWMRSPIRVSGSAPRLGNNVPGYGQHTEAVLLAHGFSADEIGQLRAEGVIVAG